MEERLVFAALAQEVLEAYPFPLVKESDERNSGLPERKEKN